MAGYLGSVPVPQATQHRESFTCTEGQTTFNTAGYTPQFVDVYLNGSHLSPADFTATNGSDVVLGVAASADDVCDIISYTPFEVANQTFTGTTTMDVAAITGVVTANAGVVVDELTIDADTITATDDFIIDAVGEISLDADNSGIIYLKDAGTIYGQFFQSSSDFYIQSQTSDKDIIFRGNDGGNVITALTLDMSAAGQAQFTNGTNALPSISFASDPDTGIIRGGTNNIAFVANGATRTYIDASTHLATSTLGTSNLALGVNAGNSIASGGNYNVVVGDEAGTAITTGDGNVAVGFEAGNDITTGSYNTIMGWKAGDKISTGGSNTAIGDAAIGSDTLGQKSVAIGSNTLNAQNFTTATDTYNTAMGWNAGAAVTTGIKNVLVGGLAGDALTDADFNVAIGNNALTADTLGSRSVAIGNSALLTQNFTTATDTYNVAVGDQAGRAVTTGILNTLVGGQAGDALTEGSRNVAMGKGALTNDTLVSRSVALGQSALAAQNFTTATDTYNTAVGHAAGGAVTTGTKNVFIGGLAGDAITSSGASVAVGYAALSTEDTHGGSTAIGSEALTVQNAGATSYNTAVGYQAGHDVTTGTQNTLIGGLAGDALTDADFNVALGTSALSADTLGSRSTAIGRATLANQNFTTATDSYNTAVGFNAGNAVTTGNNNTFVGGLAGDAITTGARNTLIGLSSGGALATANSDNTFIGTSSGENITSGDANTILGRYNGNQGSLDIRTASNYIVLSDGDGNVAAFKNANKGIKIVGNNGVGDLSNLTSGAHEITNEQGSSDYTLRIRNTNSSGGGFPLSLGYDNTFDDNTSRFITCGDPTTNRFYVMSDGDVQNHDNSYGAISDQKLKQQIVDASSQWDDIKALTIRKYKFNSDVEDYGDSNELWRLGVVAQEVEAAGMNGLVKDNPDKGPENPDATTTTKSVKYSILYMKAVKALQEAMTRIEALETKVATLEG